MAYNILLSQIISIRYKIKDTQ